MTTQDKQIGAQAGPEVVAIAFVLPSEETPQYKTKKILPSGKHKLITLQSHREAIAKKDAALRAAVEALKELVSQNETSLLANSVSSKAMKNARAAITQANEVLGRKEGGV